MVTDVLRFIGLTHGGITMFEWTVDLHRGNLAYIQCN